MIMAIPVPAQGRGAWTKTAKPNGSIYYEFIKGKPLDGATTPLKDVNFQAVNLGVQAIQEEVNARGYLPPLTADGVLGPKSSTGIKWVQSQLGVSPDGRLGATTARALWRRVIQQQAVAYKVNPEYLWGFMCQESSADPGAVGFTTPSDRGLAQINIVVHTDVAAEEAHNPTFAFRWAAKSFASSWNKYSAKGIELQEACSIANHNSPVSAQTWYKTGRAPNSRIQDYVDKILSFSETW